MRHAWSPKFQLSGPTAYSYTVTKRSDEIGGGQSGKILNANKQGAIERHLKALQEIISEAGSMQAYSPGGENRCKTRPDRN